MLKISNSHKKLKFSFLIFLSILLAIASITFGTSNLAASSANPKNSAENLSSQNTRLLASFLETKPYNFLNANLKTFITEDSEPESIFAVNNNGDSNDIAPGNGVCADASGNCTLRAAIQEANATAGIDEITFTLSTPATIDLNSALSPADLTITNRVTITGPGARLLTVNGNINTTSGIFNINAASGTTSISGITVANSGGHGINNNGRLNLSDVAIKDNFYGIYNTNRLDLNRVLINNNTSGGIYLTAASIADISNTTITNNTSSSSGGGIHSLSKDVTLTNVTISHNTATTSGGGFYYNNSAAGINVRNTIIANNTAAAGPDIFTVVAATGTFVSRGNNLIGKNLTNIGFADGTNGDKVGTLAAPIDPLLGLLQNNGGQTDTRNLGAASPAKNAGNICVTDLSCAASNPPVALATDQRGTDHPRLYEAGVDIGAFESFYPVPVIASFVPDNWGTGRGTFELTVNGSKFVADSIVKWNGTNRTTTFVSNTQLKAQILASDVTVAGQSAVTVTNPTPGGGASAPLNFTVADCSYSINPTSQTFTNAGGNGGTTVTTPNGCAWTAVSNAAWITVTAGNNESASGTVSFTVAANNGPGRSGTLTIAGQTFTVNQADGCTSSISPTNVNAPAAGLTSSFNITTSNSGCNWTATSNAAWISVVNGTGTGSGAINYTVSANTGSNRTGTVTVNGQIFTANQTSGCAYILTPNNATFGANGGTANFSVTTDTGCVWTATSNAGWITVNAGASGNGNGTVSFTVAANNGPQRTGTITVNGQTYTVTQNSGCTFSLTPASTNVPATSSTSSVSVTASNSGCTWSAVSNDSWLTVTGGSTGTGNGTVNFSVAANTGSTRVGTITVAGQTFTVNQLSGCTFSINPSNQSFSATAGAGNFAVTANSGCGWSAFSNSPWITITSGNNGSGNGTVSFAVAANPGPVRSGTITAAGQTFTVTQDNGCAYSLSPSFINAASSGVTSSVNLFTSDNGCPWSAASNASWITITNGTSGTGSKTINFTVAANNGPARSSTLTIAGQTFTINQFDGCTFSLSSSGGSFTSAGASSSFNVIASNSACNWSAASNDSWITITNGLTGIGNGVVQFTVAANTGPARNGTITAAGQTFSVNQSIGCIYSLTPTNFNAPVGGGTSNFNVNTAAGCPWTAVSNDSWITITAGGSGSGSGTVTFSAAANNGPARIGTITAGGQTFTVNQGNGCSYTLTPASTNVPAGGISSSVTVTASNSGCNWSAVSNASWITITGGSTGTGSGAVNFSVSANTGPARSGTLTVAGQTFTVNQSSGCTFTLSPNGTGFDAGGGSGSFNVTTNNTACTWTASTTDSWITIISGTSGTGNGTVSFMVAPNVSPSRTGTINVNGQTFTINQSIGCAYTISPTSLTAPAGGTTGSFNLNAGAGCPWTVASNDSWISITSSLTGTGSSTITFSVAANNGPNRSGTITVGGRTFTVNQDNGCTFSLSATSASISAGGGTGSVNVTASNAGCQWSAVVAPNTLWITITGGSTGTGNGTVNFSVAANTGPLRSGIITVAGLTFTVNQDNGCVYSLSSNSTNVNEDGGTRSFNIIANAGCTWTAVSNNTSFITITAGASGNGGGTVTFSVAANTGSERTGTITAAGQTFTVNQINLKVTNLNDNGPGSLRRAVTNANNTPGDDIITFQPSAYGIIFLTSGEITITNSGSLEIRGPGTALLTVSGGNASRIFYTNNATVSLSDMTLFGGNGVSSADPNSSFRGGAIYAKGGSLTLNRMQVIGNSISGASNGTGGGVNLSGGNHLIRNSLFYNNRSSFGAGIFTEFGSLSVVNTTLSANAAANQGGAIYSVSDIMLRNVTVTNNSSLSPSPRGGGIIIEGREFNFINSIISENTGPEITFNGGVVTSLGNNLIGDLAGDSADTQNPISYTLTDILDTSPRLAPLGNYGGVTPTKALLPGSPAINSGNSTNAPVTDQRGAPRILDNAIDIGAFEYSVPMSPGASVLPNGAVDAYYSQSISASRLDATGSTPSFIYAIKDGSLPAGLTISQGGLIQGTPTAGGVYTFTIQATDTDGMAGANIYTISIGCSYSINSTSQAITAAGGNGTVNVTSVTGCSWTAVSNVPWISVTNGSSGSGSGAVQFTVTANTGLTRSGTLTIAGQTFTVNQAGGCTFSINPPNQSVVASGGSGSFAVTSGCTWNAVSNTPWITVTNGANGTGNGTVSFSVAANTGPTRSGSITVGGQTFTVNQASGCAYSLSASGMNIPVGGGTGNFTVNTGAGCDWSAATNNSWITITAGGNGPGVGTVSFSMTANTGPARIGTITAAGQSFNINQAGNTNRQTAFDYDGDGKADISVFRPSNGIWYLLNSQSGFGGLQFGAAGDRLVPADYDGDGRTDVAVYRAGVWYLQRSSLGFTNIQFGTSEDIPVPADYDGDGKADIAVYRPSIGTWFLQRSTLGFLGTQFGINGDIPFAGDFDGDAKSDIAVFRPSNGIWYMQQSTAGFTGVQFGATGDKLVAADYDGDGKTDLAVYRPSNGFWYLNRSQLGFTGIQFGISTDVPVPADYDGDGKTDIAVYRNDTWFLQRSTAGFIGVQFGSNGDKPIPNAFVAP